MTENTIDTKITDINPEHKISVLNGFLCWFAGVDIDAMKQCPKSQHTKHATIGGAVLFTGILAFFSSFYAIFMVFQNEYLAFCVGIFWALGIINLDKYLIITTKKENQWYNVPIRLVMAIIIGLAVSRPLELRIFKTEIEEKLREQLITKQTDIRTNFDRQIAAKQQIIDDAQLKVEEMRKIYLDEMDGAGGTKKRGIGDIATAKKVEFEKEEIKVQNDIKPIKEQIEVLRKQQENGVNELNTKQSYGILAQNNALSAIDDAGASVMIWVITLLLMMFEITPILLKVTTKSGCYEKVVEATETNTEECYNELMSVNKQLASIKAQKKYESEKATLLKVQAIQIIGAIVDFCKDLLTKQEVFITNSEASYKKSENYNEYNKIEVQKQINDITKKFSMFIVNMYEAMTKITNNYKQP